MKKYYEEMAGGENTDDDTDEEKNMKDDEDDEDEDTDTNTDEDEEELVGGVAKASKPYVVDGKKYKMKFGSRRQVFNGTAYQTKGNLKQKDIKKNKQDRFVSVKKSLMATKEQRLLKYGYGAKKGKFGYVRVKPVRTAKRKRSASARKKSAAASAAPVAASAAAVADAAEGETERVSPLASRRVGIVRRMKKTKRKTKRRGTRRKRGTKRKGASRGIKKGSKGRR